jgi:hypothetical protein
MDLFVQMMFMQSSVLAGDSELQCIHACIAVYVAILDATYTAYDVYSYHALLHEYVLPQ